MGCDIHAVIEYKTPDGRVFEFSAGELWLPRNYGLFLALAGVRADENEHPMYPPRGLPARYSDAVGKLFFQMVIPDGKENEEWLRGLDYVLESVADDWVSRKMSFYSPDSDDARKWVSCPDWHTPSWLNYTELPNALAHFGLSIENQSVAFQAAFAAMEILARHYGADRVRLVFWFDN